MPRILAASALGAAALSAVLIAPAQASSYSFSNCTSLARVYHHGVAKSAAAASYQVRQGYGRPATTARAKKVYWANYRSMDRDHDGTACER